MDAASSGLKRRGTVWLGVSAEFKSVHLYKGLDRMNSHPDKVFFGKALHISARQTGYHIYSNSMASKEKIPGAELTFLQSS